MKAYKATHNLKCRDHQFEINETYSTDTLEICKSGFHFCKEMLDTLNYYKLNNKFVLLEVEILGDTQYEGDKGVTDKLKVLRIIPEEEWNFMTRNEKGNRVVNFKSSCGFEWWYEYDVNVKVIHCKNSGGYEWWIEYDVDGNETHCKDSNGYEWWREYDVPEEKSTFMTRNEKGNRVLNFKSSCGFEWWYEYDVNAKVIHCKNSGGYEWWIEYDVNGNEIHCKDSNGYEWGKSVKN